MILSLFVLLVLFLTGSSPQSISVTLSTIQSTISDGVAASAGTKAIFTNGSTSVEVYDSNTASWTLYTPVLTQPKILLAATGYAGTQAVFAGGLYDQAGGQTQATVDIYNSTSGGWTSSSLCKPRSYLAATTVGEYAIFAGGSFDRVNPTGVPDATVDIYNGATGEWTCNFNGLSIGRKSLAATSLSTKAFFAGGVDVNLALSKVVDIYDTSTGLWSTGSLSVAREMLSAASVGTQVLFAGGLGAGNAPSSVVDIYDTSTGLWSTASLSSARYDIAAVTLGSDVFFCRWW